MHNKKQKWCLEDELPLRLDLVSGVNSLLHFRSVSNHHLLADLNLPNPDFLDFQPTQDVSFKRFFDKDFRGFETFIIRIQVVTVLSLQVGGFPTRAQHQWIHHLRQGAGWIFDMGNGCYLRSPEGTTPRDENWKTIDGFWGRILEKSLGLNDPWSNNLMIHAHRKGETQAPFLIRE